MLTPASVWSFVGEWWPLILGGGALFVAMRLMRRTYRLAGRREYDGIRWRGIQWQKPEEQSAPAEDDDAT